MYLSNSHRRLQDCSALESVPLAGIYKLELESLNLEGCHSLQQLKPARVGLEPTTDEPEDLCAVCYSEPGTEGAGYTVALYLHSEPYPRVYCNWAV